MVAVWLPTPRRAHSVGCGVSFRLTERATSTLSLRYVMNSDKEAEPVEVISRRMQNTMFGAIPVRAGIWFGILI